MRAILKQTSYLFFAQILNRVISFFYLIYLARTLGVFDFGLLTVALAYFSILSGIADFGLNRYLIREVARDKSKQTELLWNIVMLRITLTSVLFAVFSIILYALDPDKMRVGLILLASIAILPQAIAFTFDSLFVAIQKLQFSAVSVFISALATALIGFYLVSKGYGLMGAVNALIIGQVVYVVTLIIFLYRHQKLVITKVYLSVIKKIVIGSLPYGLLSVLGLLYFRVDAILLSYLKGNYETGIYGAAYRFLEAVIFIPTAFSMALFPVLSRFHDTSAKDINKLYFKSFKIMLVLGLVVVLGYLFILPGIIKIVLPQYLSSITAIKILALSIPFMFIHVPAVSVLLSTDKYLKQVLGLSILALTFNVVANLIFIPRFGFIAASWVTVASEILSFIIFFLFTKFKILDNPK
ncbi:MAG: flippase [Candidatus Daviesbacteria bacterium]|nr:flippase [Candidatus Daviesbacteria bacterium]